VTNNSEVQNFFSPSRLSNVNQNVTPHLRKRNLQTPLTITPS